MSPPNPPSFEAVFYNTQTRIWEVPAPGTSIEPYIIFKVKLIEPTTGGNKTVNLATSAVLTNQEIQDVLNEQARLSPCGDALPPIGDFGRIVYVNVIDATFDESQPFQPLVSTSYSANYKAF